MSNLPDFDRLIRKYGFKVTSQRRIIMRSIWDNGEHATIEEVLRSVQEFDSSINPATVYRSIDSFIENDLVIATNIEGKTVYEIAIDTPHHHIICRMCGYDQKFDPELFLVLVQKLDQGYEFEVESEHLVLIGLCKKCRQQS